MFVGFRLNQIRLDQIRPDWSHINDKKKKEQENNNHFKNRIELYNSTHSNTRYCQGCVLVISPAPLHTHYVLVGALELYGSLFQA